MTISLRDKDSLIPVKVGDRVRSFRGGIAKVTGWPTNGRNRVWVKWHDSRMDTEYFPDVFNLEWYSQRVGEV